MFYTNFHYIYFGVFFTLLIHLQRNEFVKQTYILVVVFSSNYRNSLKGCSPSFVVKSDKSTNLLHFLINFCRKHCFYVVIFKNRKVAVEERIQEV